MNGQIRLSLRLVSVKIRTNEGINIITDYQAGVADMNRMEELKVDKIEDLEEITGGTQERAGGTQERAYVYGIKCQKCGSDDLEVLQKDIFGRMKLHCRSYDYTWWRE